MSDKSSNPFGVAIPTAPAKGVKIGALKTRKKPEARAEVLDSAAERHGFTSREPSPKAVAETGAGEALVKTTAQKVKTRSVPVPEPKKRGRPASPRVGQVHAKVLPPVQDEIAEEARRRGVVQGVIIEEAWALYKQASAKG